MDTEELRKLLDEATPGPWVEMLGTVGRNKICASYMCINGLSALFTIADVNVPDESERGYTDDAFNPYVALKNARLIALAPTLARKVIAAEKLVEALRWYASQDAWTIDQVEGPYGDYGDKAIKALAAWEAAQ